MSVVVNVFEVVSALISICIRLSTLSLFQVTMRNGLQKTIEFFKRELEYEKIRTLENDVRYPNEERLVGEFYNSNSLL